ncbi:MAG: hypothetical protein J5657_02970 [Clostridiales bacterium]|nr:hypothetical protein [Clostridiales bacterium]
MNYREGSEHAVSDRGYFIAAAICAVVMIAVGICFYVITTRQEERESTINEFKACMASGDYSGAIVIYRSVQDDVISKSPEDAAKAEYELNMLEQMETIVGERVEKICRNIRYERYVPSKGDVEFLEEMQEITSSLVSAKFNELCEEFLLGTIEKPDIIFIFDQLSPISNFSATAGPLLREIDYIETAKGDVRNAEEAFSGKDYISAVKSYRKVLTAYEGFVHSYSEKRIDEIKEVMYEPLIGECEHMLEKYKFYSAEKVLSDMAEIFPEDDIINNALLEATSNTVETTEYKGKIPVLCVRNLICDTDTAFKRPQSGSDNDYYITVNEFRAILEELYANDYILVDPLTYAGMENETYMVERPLTIPVGKKPVVIMIDNLTYGLATVGDGVCTKLTLNDKGEILSEYTTGDGEVKSGREYEAIGILDSFVSQHPDFSFDGVKGTIAVSGFESVFGYVVSRNQADYRQKTSESMGLDPVSYTDDEIKANCKTVSNIAAALKDNGWQFASNTYAFFNSAKNEKIDSIKKDTQLWLDEIGSLLGEVHMISYPNGNYIPGSDERAEYLKSKGFRVYFGTGTEPYTTYGYNYLYYDRIMVSSWTLSKYNFKAFFDKSKIMDPARSENSK